MSSQPVNNLISKVKEAPLVKVVRNGQITLPAKLREAMNIKEGDYLEIEVEEQGKIVLKPKAMVDKEKKEAWEDLDKLLEQVHQKNKDVDPEQVEQDVLQTLQSIRKSEQSPKNNED